MAGPWDKYAQQPVAPAAPMGGAPVVVGTPRPEKPKDPPSGYKPNGNGLTFVQGGPADPYRPGGELDPNKPKPEDKDPKVQEAERTAAFLATRVAGGATDLQAALKDDPGAAKPGVIASMVGVLPGIGDEARNFANSEGRQRVEAAQLDILDAALTLGTGAAYNAEQLESYRRSYFPSLTDEPKTVADKKVRLERLLAAARLKAGNAAPQIDAALAALNGGAAPAGGGTVKFNDERDQSPPGYRMTPEQTELWNGYLARNKGNLDPAKMGEAFAVITGGYGLPAQDAEQVIDYLAKGGDPSKIGVDYSKTDALTPAQQAEVDARLAKGGPTGAAVAGAADAATFGFSDELAAGGDALQGALAGNGSFSDLYADNIQTERGYKEALDEKNGGAYLTGQLAGGAAIPFGAGARGAVGLGKVGLAQGGAYGFGSAEGNALQRLPGAATGAVVGGTAGAALGKAMPYVGNALSKYAPGPSATTAARQAEADAARPVIEAAERQGLSLRQPDVRPGLRGDMAAAEKSPTVGARVGDTLRADRDAMADKVKGLAPEGAPRDEYAMGNRIQEAVQRHGQRTKDEATVLFHRAKELANKGAKTGGAKEIAREGNERSLTYTSPDGEIANIHIILGKDGAAEISIDPFLKDANRFGPAEVRAAYSEIKSLYPEIKSFHGERLSGANPGRVQSVDASREYTKAATFAPRHKINPLQTIKAIDERIAQLQASGESANAAEIKVLEGIQADMGKTGLSIETLQTQRRAMRQRLKDNGIDYGSADASYMEILGVAGRELESSLAANPRALGALKKANQHYAERSAFRKEVARQFIGTPNAPVKPETAATRFMAMVKDKGDYNRFSRMFKEMDPEETADFAATIADGLGKTKSGEFAYGKFVSDLEGMNPRAIKDLFGADGAKAIEDLRMVASAKSGTAAGLNHSNTGAVTSRNNAFKDMVLTAFGGGVAGIPGAMAGAASRGLLERFTSKRAAKMLLNPDFTKWLRQIPPSRSPKVINEHFARLTNIAARDAVFAADVKALQNVLAETFAQSPGRLAAAQDKADGRREPPNGQ